MFYPAFVALSTLSNSTPCYLNHYPFCNASFSTSLLKRHSHQWTEEKKRSYLDRIQTSIEQLSHLMDEVLTIGKAEAGKLTFEPKQFNLDQFCRELVAQMQLSNSSQHNVTFVSRGNCKEVCVDRKLLQPILTNLLENAIKYSPTGSTVNLEGIVNLTSGKRYNTEPRLDFSRFAHVFPSSFSRRNYQLLCLALLHVSLELPRHRENDAVSRH
jgi:hypothetical protein